VPNIILAGDVGPQVARPDRALQAGEPVHVVSQRLGHASLTITLSVYAHALPGDQKRAASRFAALVGEA
jgi:integrase